MGADKPEVAVSIMASSTDPETITRVVEVFARAATGLALEGLNVSISAVRLDDEEENRG